MSPAITEASNIYCDESTHLENDGMPFMVFGAVACPKSKTREAVLRIREIKERHGLPRNFEIKWNKISNGKVQFYIDLIDYFFDDDDLGFRVVTAPKKGLNHEAFDRDHDDFYYVMLYYLLNGIIRPRTPNFIYLDKKDTRGGRKARKLHEVLANKFGDRELRWIQRIQIVESHHAELLQLADLLIGAVNYDIRGFSANAAKCQMVDRIKTRSGRNFDKSTPQLEQKFNVFAWQPRGIPSEQSATR